MPTTSRLGCCRAPGSAKVRVEIALNRSEMEVPVELWLSAEGRVDEGKLSALTAVRTTLHVPRCQWLKGHWKGGAEDLIYRPSTRFSSLDGFLSSLASLEHSAEIGGAGAFADLFAGVWRCLGLFHYGFYCFEVAFSTWQA